MDSIRLHQIPILLTSFLALSTFFSCTAANPILTPRATVPGPPADPAQNPGDGSGKWNSEGWGWKDVEVKSVLKAGVTAFKVKGWGQAARAMGHYLDNKGTDLSVDLAEMMSDIPALKNKMHDLAQAEAKKKVETFIGPWVTLGFTSPWTVWHAWNDATNAPYSYDWYYALGEYSYAVSGVITKDSKGAMTLQWKSHVFDRYNWDNSGKTSNLGPISLSHKEIGHLHKCGWAREYTVRGSSKEQLVKNYDSKKAIPAVDTSK